MSWYDYINPLNQKHGIGGALNQFGLNGPSPGEQTQLGKLDEVGGSMGELGQGAAGFAGQAQQNYSDMTGRLGGALDNLQGQMNGQNSVSALQLHQALQQNLANQQAMAAGANPNNAPGAARTAAIQMGQLGGGLAGQQAVAGLQERNQAGQLYASLLGAARGQDLQGTLGGYNAATGAYSGAAGAYGGGATAQANAPTLGGSALGAVEGISTLKGKGK